MTGADAARDALVEEARRDAARLLAEADTEVEATLRRAREQADAIVARAREAGRAEGRIAAEQAQAQARLGDRMGVLAAQRASYDALRGRARRAVLALRDDPGYDRLLDRLTAAVRRELGPDAQVDVDPPDAGGVRGRAGSRRVDHTLAALADRCVERLGPAARRLWE